MFSILVNVGLLAIKLLATFLKDPSTKETALLQISEWLSDANAANSTTLQLVAATMYVHDDNVKDAIKILRHGLNMEQQAMLVQLFLRIDRLDLAQKQVKAMKAVDEDGILGNLATAWTYLNVVLKHFNLTSVCLTLLHFTHFKLPYFNITSLVFVIPYFTSTYLTVFYFTSLYSTSLYSNFTLHRRMDSKPRKRATSTTS